MNNEKKANLELTEQEATILLGIINQAVKSTGLDDGGGTAQNGIYFVKKIKDAFNEKKEFISQAS